ncbi:MAG: HPr kinase/phosphatase C-terminal domain-containing protein [Novosphingobium sp.]
MIPHQASCVALGGGALVIEGPPGSGKTSLALALIDRGAVLIGDDGVLIEARGGRVLAAPHPATAGLVEVRNLGLIRRPTAAPAPVGLILRLDPEAPRYVENAERIELLGVAVPMLRLTPHEPILPIKAELAWARFADPPR